MKMNRATPWSQAQVDKARPVVQRWLKFTTAWLRFTAGLLAPLFFSIDVIVGIQTYTSGYIMPWDFAIMVIRGIGGTVLFLVGAWQAKNHAGPIFIALALAGIGVLVLDPFSRPFFISFPLAWLWILFFMGAGSFCLAMCVFHVIALNLDRRNRGFSFFQQALSGLKKDNHVAVLAIVVMAGFGTTFMVMINRTVGAVPITIMPKEYQIQFRFWASGNPSDYTSGIWYRNGTAILDAMSRHGATIQNVQFWPPDENGLVETFSPNYLFSAANSINTTLGWFKELYPGIKFQVYASGIGYNSSGNYEGSIYTPALIKRTVNMCRDFNITNVVGLYSDWEGGLKYANRTMNAWNQALLTDAFAYVRQYFPNWTLSCCSGTAAYWDFIDDDDDLQYFRRDNIFNPWWDDYGPMIYRCGNTGATNADPWTYEGAYGIYGNAKVVVDGIMDGDESRASMWIGITGAQCYNPNFTIYEHGEPIGFGESKGFDNLCRDILILKHFGIPTVSFFKATNDSDPVPLDFFNVYGSDALDRLNATVNGPNSTQSFTIWSDPMFMMKNGLCLTDYLLNFDRLPWMVVGGLHVLCGILFAGSDRLKIVIGRMIKRNR